MGARQYDPTLGRFLETDPIEGGSANDYDYTNADPVNGRDLDGNCKTHHKGAWGYVRSARCRASHGVRRSNRLAKRGSRAYLNWGAQNRRAVRSGVSRAYRATRRAAARYYGSPDVGVGVMRLAGAVRGWVLGRR